MKRKTFEGGFKEGFLPIPDVGNPPVIHAPPGVFQPPRALLIAETERDIYIYIKKNIYISIIGSDGRMLSLGLCVIMVIM